MSPTPEKVGPDGWKSTKEIIEARESVGNFLRAVIEKAEKKARRWGGITEVSALVGLILEEDGCVHPAVEIPGALRGKIFALGGKGLEGLYPMSNLLSAESQIEVHWFGATGRKFYTSYKGMLRLGDESGQLMIDGQHATGLLLVPGEKGVERSIESCLEQVMEFGGFPALLDGLLKAAGMTKEELKKTS